MTRWPLLIPFALPLALAACAGPDVVSHAQPVGYLKDARQVAAQADWSNPRVVEVELVNHAFRPNELTFRRGEAVRLILRNTSTSDHTFVSEPFFKGIAVKKLVTPQETVEAPWVEKVSVEDGVVEELWFVPARYGAYRFECTVPGHALMGMTGVINVVE